MDIRLDTQQVLRPPSWLVCGMEWPETEGDIAEAAFVVAPATVPRSVMPPDAVAVLDYAEAYAREHSVRVVFFSDLTRWLSERGTSWLDKDIDWCAAQAAMREIPILALYMAVNRRTHQHLCNTARRRTLRFLRGGTEVLTASEREEVRTAMLDLLDREWPSYVESVVDNADYSES